MAEQHIMLVNFYKGWDEYQERICEALTPLSQEQLTLRSAPHLRSIGMITTHMVGARARWLQLLTDGGDDEVAAMGNWDRTGQPTRSVAELVRGLGKTGQAMQSALAKWTSTDLEYIYQGMRAGEAYKFSRQWVIWHVIEHDLHHGGEISLTLGIHGLEAPHL